MQQPGKKRIWNSAKRAVFVVAFGVLLYELCENFNTVWQAVSRVASILSPAFMGIALAFIVNLPMRFFELRAFKKWRPRPLKRVCCMLLAGLLVGGVVTLILLIILPQLTESGRTLVENFDAYVDSVTAWGQGLWDNLQLNAEIKNRLNEFATKFWTQLDQSLENILSTAVRATVSAATIAFDLLIAAIISVYALYNKETFLAQSRKLVRAVFAPERADWVLDVAARTNMALSNYFRGLVVDCFCLGLLCYIAMRIFSFPYALLISVIIGATQVLPIIGPWIGGALGALLLLIVDPMKALWFVVLLLSVQQIDNQLVYPRIMGNAVGISGIWVLIAVLLGSGLFGALGIILCVPVTAVLYTLVSDWVNARLARVREEEPPC